MGRSFVKTPTELRQRSLPPIREALDQYSRLKRRNFKYHHEQNRKVRIAIREGSLHLPHHPGGGRALRQYAPLLQDSGQAEILPEQPLLQQLFPDNELEEIRNVQHIAPTQGMITN